MNIRLIKGFCCFCCIAAVLAGSYLVTGKVENSNKLNNNINGSYETAYPITAFSCKPITKTADNIKSSKNDISATYVYPEFTSQNLTEAYSWYAKNLDNECKDGFSKAVNFYERT